MYCFLVTLGWLYVVYRFLDYLVRQPRISKLQDRYVFITGCDTGFGNATAKELDRLGMHVFAGCLTEAGEVSLKKECSDRVVPVKLNVTKHESVVQAFKEVKRLLPEDKGLWGLINNAGIGGKCGPSEWCTRDDYQIVLEINFLGLMDVTATFLPLLKKAKGRVVNMASVYGRVSVIGGNPYCVSKYCVEAYSDALRREMRDFGVSVLIMEPGAHKTSLSNPELQMDDCRSAYMALPPHLKEEYGQEFLDQYLELMSKNFLKRLVTGNMMAVVKGYIHAVTAMFPRGRYLIGEDAKLWWWPMTFVTEWLSDFLLEKMNGGSPVPASMKKK